MCVLNNKKYWFQFIKRAYVFFRLILCYVVSNLLIKRAVFSVCLLHILIHFTLNLHYNTTHNCYRQQKLIAGWMCWTFRYYQRIKGTAVEANLISLFERFTLSATLSHNHRIHSPFNLIENQTNQQTYTKHQFGHLISTKNSHIFPFRALKRTIHNKMKDLISGNLNKISSELILDQKISYNNGNDDR